MTHCRTVHPNLMRAPGLRACLDQAIVKPALCNAQIGFGGFAAMLIDHGAVLPADIGVQGMLCRILVPFWLAFHNGMIDLLDFMALELGIQMTVRFRRARKDHYPRCAFIEPMHNPDLFAAELLFEHGLQGGGVLVPAFVDNGQRCGFIDNDNLWVLIDDLKHGGIMPYYESGLQLYIKDPVLMNGIFV